MRKEKTFQVSGKTLLAHELTVKDVNEVIEVLGSEKIDIIDMLFPDSKVTAHALRLSLGASEEDLDDYTPDEIGEMLKVVAELNPTLTSLIERLAKIGREILAKRSENPSAD